MKFSTVALFCEDIREEKNGILSFVGVLPDNINVNDATNAAPRPGTEIPRSLPKLCVYARFNLDPLEQPSNIRLQLVMPDGQIIPMGGPDLNVIKKSQEQAKESGLPFAGVAVRAVMAPFKLPKPGLLRAEAVTESGVVQIIGAINFKKVDATSSPTVN